MTLSNMNHLKILCSCKHFELKGTKHEFYRGELLFTKPAEHTNFPVRYACTSGMLCKTESWYNRRKPAHIMFMKRGESCVPFPLAFVHQTNRIRTFSSTRTALSRLLGKTLFPSPCTIVHPTLKLSPQPHIPVAFGFSNTNSAVKASCL